MQQDSGLALPIPDRASAEHSKRCATYIRERIRDAGGSISFAEFMHYALYAPGLGYYSAGTRKFGAGGDFVTAPEISGLFARMVAAQCAPVMQHVDDSSLEIRGEVNGVTVYDDFAHHPTAIASTLAGLRRHRNGGRLLAILEPRSNTMRLGIHRHQLAASLSEADAVWIYQPEDLSWDVQEVTASLMSPSFVSDNVDELVVLIVGQVRAGDKLVVMSNGGFGGIHEKLLAALANAA